MSRVIRFDLGVDRPERAMKFYATVFGWKIDKVDGVEDYWAITTGEEGQAGIDGGMVKRRYPTESTTCWIATPSVDESLRKIVEAGGKVLAGKTPIPGFGFYGYCVDTEGNVFGVIQVENPAT
jgi:predicted enzyme related to lactoylglutathione lyase